MLSVIIPCLNEEQNLGSLLAQLREQKDIAFETIVSDGGSTDNTIQIATQHGVKVVHSRRGRGSQQNAGAAEASGDYLLFLHADSRLEHEDQLIQSLQFIETAPERTAAHYRVRFETTLPEVAEKLRFFEYKTGLNRDGTFSGDQGLLIRRTDFKLLGGYSEKYHFLEDKEFAGRFTEFGHFRTLPATLFTSARRFEQEGLEQRLILNTLIMGMFHLDNEPFFSRASEAYRENSAEGTLNLAPFFLLAQESVFDDGAINGMVRCLSIGRYATKNLWQVCLAYSLPRNKAEDWLRIYDRYLNPLTDNPLGYLLGTIVVISWFYIKRLQFSRFNQT